MNLEKLKGHVPDKVIAQIPGVMEKFQINTPLRLAHFLAQCGHESGGFRLTKENLNYSAKGLMGIFKKYFPSEAKANEYARKPEKIAIQINDRNPTTDFSLMSLLSLNKSLIKLIIYVFLYATCPFL